MHCFKSGWHYFANKGPSSHGYGFSCAEELILLNCGVGEDFWESLGLQGDPTSPSQRRSVLGVHWKDSCWSWNSNHLAILCKGLTHLKRPWCWERLKAGAEGYNRGWDGWMASLTQWTWVWVDSRSWWGTGRPGAAVMGSQRVGHDWVTKLNWTELILPTSSSLSTSVLDFIYANTSKYDYIVFFFPLYGH